ncbi:hypothetical protein D3C84_480620 [compost metagenome]
MGWSRTSSDQGRANRAGLLGKLLLQEMQGRQEGLEGPTAKQFASRLTLMALKGLQATLLIDPLGLVGKQHGIAVESDAQLIARGPPRSTGEDGGRAESRAQRAAYIFGVSREKQMAAERRQIGIGAAPADKGRAGDAQAVVLDRIERAQAGIGAVARHQNHLHPRLAQSTVQPQQLLDQGESVTWHENLVLMFDLIAAIGFDPLPLIHTMTLAQIEQRPRGNRQHQLVAHSRAHAHLNIRKYSATMRDHPSGPMPRSRPRANQPGANECARPSRTTNSVGSETPHGVQPGPHYRPSIPARRVIGKTNTSSSRCAQQQPLQPVRVKITSEVPGRASKLTIRTKVGQLQFSHYTVQNDGKLMA